jgi:hypothetical protein
MSFKSVSGKNERADSFLHGLRGDEADWGIVPDLVEASLSSFEVISMEYSAELQSYADATRSCEQILTRIKNEHPESDPIFLIGCSNNASVLYRSME